MPYYRCTACGLTSYSAAAYSATSICPNCSTGLSDEAKLPLPRDDLRALRAASLGETSSGSSSPGWPTDELR